MALEEMPEEDPFGGGRWPIRPRLQKGEGLASWWLRISGEFGLRPEAFCRLVLQRRPLYAPDPVRASEHSILDKLCAATGTDRREASSSALSWYVGRAFWRMSASVKAAWVLPMGKTYERNRAPGAPFCPLCLITESIPTFQRDWRLAISSCCLQHNVLLEDRCKWCGAPAAPFHAVLKGHRVHLCWACGAQLGHDGTTPADASVVQLQSWLQQTLEAGWIALSDTQYLPGPAAFEIVHRLMSGIAIRDHHAAGQTDWAVQAVKAAELPALLRATSSGGSASSAIPSSLRPGERHRLLRGVADLLADGPDALRQIIQDDLVSVPRSASLLSSVPCIRLRSRDGRPGRGGAWASRLHCLPGSRGISGRISRGMM